MIKYILKFGLSIFFIFPLQFSALKSNNLPKRSCKNAIKKELQNITLKKTKLRESKISRTKVIDINDDLRKEILIEKSYGGAGNCCPPELEIIFFNASCDPNKFKLEQFDNVWGGWEEVKFKKVKNKFILSAENNSQGFGNRELYINNVDYFFDGKTLKFLSKILKEEITTIAEIRTSKLKNNIPDHLETFLKFDLNNNNMEEIISCQYWDRWGTFKNCLIKKGDSALQIGQNITPKRLGILKEQKNGWNLLVIDYDEKYFFDPKTKKYRKFSKVFTKSN